MSRIFCVPGIVFLLAALVVSFLASISLPHLPVFSVVRVDFDPARVENSMTNLRFGIWTSCYYNVEEERTCQKNAIAYSVDVSSENATVEIGPSWTRGLVLQPVATGFTLIALCLSFSTNLFAMLLAMLASFAAALVHLISFLIQIALFAFVKNKMNDLEINASTKPAPGFWLVFASLILCLLGACTVCFGRRRDKAKQYPLSTLPTTRATPVSAGLSEKPKPGLLARFRKTEPVV